MIHACGFFGSCTLPKKRTGREIVSQSPVMGVEEADGLRDGGGMGGGSGCGYRGPAD